MNPEEKYRKMLIKAQLAQPNKLKPLFNKAADKMAALANNPNAKNIRKQSFAGSKPLIHLAADIKSDLHQDLLDVIKGEVKYSWNLSTSKNAETLKGVPVSEFSQQHNAMALAAFVGRGNGPDTLSERVWNVAEQARLEMELTVATGIMAGDSAAVIAKNIKQYLNNPDALFRRVRDKATGKLVESKAMKAYHPGRGVYKSAFKNAVRVARTETNMAYLTADHLRWLKMDSVIGIRIALSDQHPEYNFPEICELLEGDYPKEFIFVGWHPQCMCHVTPILYSEENFKKFLRGDTTKIKPQNRIKELPQNFRAYVQNNAGKLSEMERPPYWFANNAALIESKVAEGVAAAIAPAVEAASTTAQIEEAVNAARFGFREIADYRAFVSYKNEFSEWIKLSFTPGDLAAASEDFRRGYATQATRDIYPRIIRKAGNESDIRTILQRWQGSTHNPEAMLLKLRSEAIEVTNATIERSPGSIEIALKSPVIDLMSSETYIRLRAMNQAYMEAIGVPDEIELFRGTDGGKGMQIKMDILEAPTSKTFFPMTDSSLAGYTNREAVANQFGSETQGITIRFNVRREDIIVHNDLLAGFTNSFMDENEFIVKGIDRGINIRDIQFSFMAEDSQYYKKFDQTVDRFAREIIERALREAGFDPQATHVPSL